MDEIEVDKYAGYMRCSQGFAPVSESAAMTARL